MPVWVLYRNREGIAGELLEVSRFELVQTNSSWVIWAFGSGFSGPRTVAGYNSREAAERALLRLARLIDGGAKAITL